LRKYKPWFDEGCSELFDQRKEANLQWLQNPGEINEDNLDNKMCRASRHFGNKNREYLRYKINELATNSKNRNMRGYQLRSNLMKDGNIDLLADSHTILNRSKRHFSHILNVYNISDIRQIEIIELNHWYLVPALLGWNCYLYHQVMDG
jgi:hypothetical protein